MKELSGEQLLEKEARIKKLYEKLDDMKKITDIDIVEVYKLREEFKKEDFVDSYLDTKFETLYDEVEKKLSNVSYNYVTNLEEKLKDLITEDDDVKYVLEEKKFILNEKIKELKKVTIQNKMLAYYLGRKEIVPDLYFYNLSLSDLNYEIELEKEKKEYLEREAIAKVERRAIIFAGTLAAGAVAGYSVSKLVLKNKTLK